MSERSAEVLSSTLILAVFLEDLKFFCHFQICMDLKFSQKKNQNFCFASFWPVFFMDDAFLSAESEKVT